MDTANAAKEHFERKRPGWFTANVFNRIIAALTGSGVSVLGARVLEVKGRSSGQPRRTPVNLLDFEGERYLVAPRGETPVGAQSEGQRPGATARGQTQRELHCHGARR